MEKWVSGFANYWKNHNFFEEQINSNFNRISRIKFISSIFILNILFHEKPIRFYFDHHTICGLQIR